MRIATIFLSLVFSSVFAGSDYFPLNVGNLWKYNYSSSTGGCTGTPANNASGFLYRKITDSYTQGDTTFYIYTDSLIKSIICTDNDSVTNETLVASDIFKETNNNIYSYKPFVTFYHSFDAVTDPLITLCNCDDTCHTYGLECDTFCRNNSCRNVRYNMAIQYTETYSFVSGVGIYKSAENYIDSYTGCFSSELNTLLSARIDGSELTIQDYNIVNVKQAFGGQLKINGVFITYPSPCKAKTGFTILLLKGVDEMLLCDLENKIHYVSYKPIACSVLKFNHLKSGILFLQITQKGNKYTNKIIVTD